MAFICHFVTGDLKGYMLPNSTRKSSAAGSTRLLSRQLCWPWSTSLLWTS